MLPVNVIIRLFNHPSDKTRDCTSYPFSGVSWLKVKLERRSWLVIHKVNDFDLKLNRKKEYNM